MTRDEHLCYMASLFSKIKREGLCVERGHGSVWTLWEIFNEIHEKAIVKH